MTIGDEDTISAPLATLVCASPPMNRNWYRQCPTSPSQASRSQSRRVTVAGVWKMLAISSMPCPASGGGRNRLTSTLTAIMTADATTRRSALKAWGSISRKAVLTSA